jgi:hypothetical protein
MYNLAVVLHVVVAVLGVGQIGALAVAVSASRRARLPLPQIASWLHPLLGWARFSMAAVVATGIWMVVMAKGAYHGMWWVRLSVLLVVITFIFQRRAVGALKKVLRGEIDAASALSRVERVAWSMCATVALITVLMEAKPF